MSDLSGTLDAPPQRRMRVLLSPSPAAAIRYGLGGLVLIIATTLVEIALHGVDVENWGSVTSSALVLVAAWSGLLLLHRYRAEGRKEWLLFSIGAFGYAAGQLMWIAQVTLLDSDAWPSFADSGFLLWQVMSISAMFIHTRSFERTTRVIFLVDSAVLAVALSFVIWETVIRSGVGDPGQFSLPKQLAMLIYPMTDIVFASMLGMMLLIGRSPARICLFIGAVLITVADVAYSATLDSTSNVSYAVSLPTWALAFVVFGMSAGLASGGNVRYDHPTLTRSLLVHIPVAGTVWLATWRYIVNDVEPTTVTVVIAILAGVMLIVLELATWYHSSTLSDRLEDNIATLRHTEAELRAL
ncbi:MAG TPA: hypothetical protein VLD86_17185, partial [Ilumatobacteraceae bacterium]|nr:hypothetical protein [Ilumatobacteraceae bacterium]